MKRAATQHIVYETKQKSRFFSKLSNFYFHLNPSADLRARQRSENPTPGAIRMCESPVVTGGERMVRLGID